MGPLAAYVKGGWAGADLHLSTLNANNGVSSSLSANANGWTVGAGPECAFGNGWSFGTEYAFYDLDAGTTPRRSRMAHRTYGGFKTEVHTIVGRLNYTFSWSARPR